MAIPETASTASLVAEYRRMKSQASKLAAEMTDLREAIKKRVMAEGTYEDERGYAKVAYHSQAASYAMADIARLQEAWLSSDVPTIRTCGATLRSFERPQAPSVYLEIKSTVNRPGKD